MNAPADYILIARHKPAPMNGSRAEKAAWVDSIVNAAEASMREAHSASDVGSALARLGGALGTEISAASTPDPHTETEIASTLEAVRRVALLALKDIK